MTVLLHGTETLIVKKAGARRIARSLHPERHLTRLHHGCTVLHPPSQISHRWHRPSLNLRRMILMPVSVAEPAESWKSTTPTMSMRDDDVAPAPLLPVLRQVAVRRAQQDRRAPKTWIWPMVKKKLMLTAHQNGPAQAIVARVFGGRWASDSTTLSIS